MEQLDWKLKAEELKLEKNNSWAETAKTIQFLYFPNDDYSVVFNRVRAHLRNKVKQLDTIATPKVVKQSAPQDIIKLLSKGVTYEELQDKLNIPRPALDAWIECLKQEGYNIISDDTQVEICNIVIPNTSIISENWTGEKILRFGLMGDTQFNSKYTQITHLHTLYDLYEQEGIETVYHTGDMDEGEEMRMGHKYECYTQGADDHVKEIIKNYPKRNNLTTKFITGNHDSSIIRRAGYDIGYAIANKRDDMQYLGSSNALVNLTDKCTLELRHPIDGTAYALSYKLQKMVEAMMGGEKPNMLAVGHYHKAEYFFYRNVHCFQTGCFQMDTPFTKGKGISVMLGGWIVECHVDDEGTITRIKPEFVPFYKAMKDDYLNWL